MDPNMSQMVRPSHGDDQAAQHPSYPITHTWDRNTVGVSRPIHIRAFCRFSSLVLDDRGNCRSASIEMLDSFGRGPVWRRWRIGQRIHFSPFKIGIVDSPRAGLHLVAERRRPGEHELRFTTPHLIREEGIFVLSPGDVTQLATPIVEAVDTWLERQVVLQNLCVTFGYRGSDPLRIDSLPSLTSEQEETIYWD